VLAALTETHSKVSSKGRVISIAIVISVSLTSLMAGVVWRQWIDQPQNAARNIELLHQYEDHWNVLNQDEVHISDWQDKTVLLNFWGSWCPPCVEEMPLLDRFNADFDTLQIIGIVVDQEKAATTFLNEHGITFPSLLLNQSVVTDLLDAFGNTALVLPYSVAFDPSGKRFYDKAGPLSEQELHDLID